MKILLTENSFSGAHGSFRIFFDEIEYSLKTSGYTVYRADNVIQAASIYEQYRPDFSIGIGKYNFLVDEKLLCELYTTPHYQWILDNPLKLPCYSSKNFTPVFIDREFAELYNPAPERFLWLPLGINTEYKATTTDRRPGIVFAGQVKNIMALQEQINQSSQRAIIEKFLKMVSSNLDASFIMQYKNFVATNKPANVDEFFRLTNSYIRCLKRIAILDKIEHYPLVLAGSIEEKKILQKKNVIHVGEIPYSELTEFFSRYTHVLHISPNFSACIHDRILRGLQAGCQVITEENEILHKTFGNSILYFGYKNFNENILMDGHQVRNIDFMPFSWEKILALIIKDYHERS
ncbi:MAG: hypothetical protein IJP53_09365 [Synergistaceae bacterium]|nr:hypothetical protein [Synergistaceae bacterium]